MTSLVLLGVSMSVVGYYENITYLFIQYLTFIVWVIPIQQNKTLHYWFLLKLTIG